VNGQPGLAAGLRAAVSAQVGEDDTAIALGSGDLPVLGTPRLLALAEAACVAAVAPQLEPGQTTVGAAVSFEHRQPSPLGASIEVQAELTDVHGRKLFFMFIAYALRDGGQGSTAEGSPSPPSEDDDAVIGAGTVQRVLVDVDRFMSNLS
jgi:fluoroacetyl-CoA thioesterase